MTCFKAESATILVSLAFGFSCCCLPMATPVIDEIDWSTMLADHDMVWGSLPKSGTKPRSSATANRAR